MGTAVRNPTIAMTRRAIRPLPVQNHQRWKMRGAGTLEPQQKSCQGKRKSLPRRQERRNHGTNALVVR
jgi:hypothetical protein